MDKRKTVEKLGAECARIIRDNAHIDHREYDVIVICCNKDGYMMSSLDPDREKRDAVLSSIVDHRNRGGDKDLSGDVMREGGIKFYEEADEQVDLSAWYEKDLLPPDVYENARVLSTRVKPCPVCDEVLFHKLNCTLDKKENR